MEAFSSVITNTSKHTNIYIYSLPAFSHVEDENVPLHLFLVLFAMETTFTGDGHFQNVWGGPNVPDANSVADELWTKYTFSSRLLRGRYNLLGGGKRGQVLKENS